MKTKISILMFSLLLAVGWTGNASAQLKADPGMAKRLTAAAVMNAPLDLTKKQATSTPQTGMSSSLKKFPGISQKGQSLKDVPMGYANNSKRQAANRAPRRADATASATHVYSWYDAITYDWVDANGAPHPGAKITAPATDPYQIAYLLGTTYMNPVIPGLKYSEVTRTDNIYPNIEFGWDIPLNARWNPNAGAGTNYSNLRIFLPSYNMTLRSITVYNQNNTVLTSWNANTAWNNGEYGTYTSNNQNYYAYTLPGWSYSYYLTMYGSSGDRYGYIPGEGTISIPASYLNGNSSIRVVIQAYSDEAGEILSVNGEGKAMTTSLASYTWTFTGSNAPTTVTPPVENGYTVFLVKVKDGTGAAPAYTRNWNSGSDNLIDYFSTYIDEVQLLTDGTRLNENTDDAGTMFAYSGELNRFYFLGKGNDYFWGSSETDPNPHMAPTYDMYEEFSPTSTDNGAQITDFYSKLLYGNSYNVIHDCRGMNYYQHYFTMSGLAGSDHRSMTNLIFWIPDNRGSYGERNYNEEFLPHVGLYTITLEATAVPDPTAEHQYLVTCDWVSSLNSILDFPVDQDYELWIYVYDEEGNPVEERMVTDDLHNTTTYTYPEPQYPESYTIVYRVYGWPTAATNSRANGGDFYAKSNLDPVLIPGYKNFLALDMNHYESDFVIDEEHNYYRNFLTVDNQNPDNALTADRINNGEDLFSLYRYDATVENPQYVKAADLLFSVDDNKVNYLIDYSNQYYIDDADQSSQSQILTGYKDLDALGYPTSGTIATLGSGEVTPPDPVVIETHTSTVTATRITTTSATWRGTGGETWNVAVNGGATNQAVTNNYAQIGTRQSPSRSVTFSTSGIEGTITSIIVDCASYNGLATLSATVGGNAFGTQNQSTPSWSNNSGGNVTFSGNASGPIVITMTNGNNGRAMYIKSIVVTYETESGGQEVAYITTTETWGFETQADWEAWTSNDNDGDGYNWSWGSGESFAQYTHSGNGALYSASYDETNETALNPDNWLISPEVTLGGTLTLWACGLDPNYAAERFRIYVLPDGADTWQQVGNTITTTANWTEYSFDLSAYQGQTGQFMIRHYGSSNQSYLFIDDITYTLKEVDPYVSGGFTLLNDYLDKRNYKQVGIVEFELPWKSIQVKLQDTSAGTSAGYFMIQSDGKLRFIMPAGYNHANVKFVIRNAPLSSNYHDGTFKLTSSTGQTQTVTFAATDGNVDREVIFEGISTGDVITITGTHTVDGTLYNYSPDFKYIRVYVQGGTGGIGEHDALNLAAIKFVDQFKAETREDKHPYRYGYVLKFEPEEDSSLEPQESAKPEVPVQHTGATLNGYYSLSEIDQDTHIGINHDEGLTMNVMNSEVNMKLTSNPQVYYYTLDRKPSTEPDANYLEISKLQKREDDTYQEMDNILDDYQNIFQPVTTPRFDNYDVKTGLYNDYMSYVPIAWTHGEQQDNRRIKWNTENRHNSYGAPIWKTGVGDVVLRSATAEKQVNGWNTSWQDGDTKCSLYMLDGIEAWGYLPTVSNIEYEPYMFRVFVESENGKLRNFKYVTQVDEQGKEHKVIVADATTVTESKEPLCVWSAYVNTYDDETLEALNTACDNVFTDGIDGTKAYIQFNKNKVDRTAGYDENGNPLGDWDQQTTNAIFGALDDLEHITQNGQEVINPKDLNIFVRFYYIVKGMSQGWTPWNPTRNAPGLAPAGYGAESPGRAPGHATAVNEIQYLGEIVSQTYYNMQGMVSDKPFDGVNIVVTRFGNGTTSVSKIIK